MEIITIYCIEQCCFTCFKLQFHRHQKQINSFYKTSYNCKNVYLAFRCVLGALSDVYKWKISFLPQPSWPTVTQVPYILIIRPTFLNKPNLCTALQACQEGKKIIKILLRSNKWLFLPSFLFILLWFKSHQTSQIKFIYLLVQLIVLILCYDIQYVYEIVLPC